MTATPVRLWEVEGDGLRPLGRHATLAAAALSLPEGAYTSLRTHGGRGILRLDQHLRRLEESAALRGRPGVIDDAVVRRTLGSALDASAHAEARLRLTFVPPRLFLAVEPFSPLPPRLYEEGVACVTLPLRRDNPHAKDTRFISKADAAYRSLPPGVNEGLLVGDDGAILEGLSSNFFALKDDVLRTEEERVLLGITRSLVLEVARGVVPVERRAVARDEIPTTAEAFITSVSREVLPVVRIDGSPVGDGRVGPRTRAIMAGFAALVARELERL